MPACAGMTAFPGDASLLYSRRHSRRPIDSKKRVDCLESPEDVAYPYIGALPRMLKHPDMVAIPCGDGMGCLPRKTVVETTAFLRQPLSGL